MNIKMEFCHSVSVRFGIQEGHLFMQQDECLNFIINFMLHYHVTASQEHMLKSSNKPLVRSAYQK